MLYKVCQKIYRAWMSWTWVIWRKHVAWDIVRGADFDDPYDVMRLHVESVSRGDLLLSAQLGQLLEEIGAEITYTYPD